MNDLFEDLCDGTKLLTLLELFTGKKMVRGERQRERNREIVRQRDSDGEIERETEREGEMYLFINECI